VVTDKDVEKGVNQHKNIGYKCHKGWSWGRAYKWKRRGYIQGSDR
jgi:hypothetical protein